MREESGFCERLIAWVGVESPSAAAHCRRTAYARKGLGSLGDRIKGAGCRSLKARHNPWAIAGLGVNLSHAFHSKRALPVSFLICCCHVLGIVPCKGALKVGRS